MKQMQRDPLAASKARKAERKADEKSGLITIKPVKLDVQPASVAGSGFKKGGFKIAFGREDKEEDRDGPAQNLGVLKKELSGNDEDVQVKEELMESDTDDDYEYYDPKRPSDCFANCAGR